MLAGEGPTEMLLRRLAPALGFRAVDLFVLADRAVPEDLAPLDAAAAPWVARTVRDAARLPGTGRRALLESIRALPQEERRRGFTLQPLGPLSGGPGARVVAMLRYRNLNWTGMAQALAFVTPTYLSAATYGVIASGRKDLTPSLVTDIAALLGIDPRDLALFTGVPLSEVPPPPSPAARDAASLLWEMRRLSAGQARHVVETARSLRETSLEKPAVDRP